MGCVGVSADIGFDAPAPGSFSLCGFSFPPKISFSLGFSLPSLPSFSLSFFFPFLTLSCDLSAPIKVDWGGGRVAVFDPDAFGECAGE